jgi:hypothetical protein
VFITVSQDKWEKAQSMIAATVAEVEKYNGWIDRKTLEHHRGFLLYVTRTFPAMVLYLKGFHLTIDGSRKDRDSNSWKNFCSRTIWELQEQGEEGAVPVPPEEPKKVKAKVRRVECNLLALTCFFDSCIFPSSESGPKTGLRTNCSGQGRLLRKLLIQSKWLDSVPEAMVQGLLQRAKHQSLPDKVCGRQ